jgi:hypothetical protein
MQIKSKSGQHFIHFVGVFQGPIFVVFSAEKELQMRTTSVNSIFYDFIEPKNSFVVKMV